MFNFLLLLLILSVEFSQSKSLNVGLLAEPSNSPLTKFFGWEQVAASVAVAFDSFKERKLLLEYDTLNLTWKNIGCTEAAAAGALVDYARDGLTHVVLGPPCPKAAEISGTIAGAYNFPIVLYGWPFSSRLMDDTIYPTVLSSIHAANYPARSIFRLLYRYSWNDVTLLTYIQRNTPLHRCGMLIDEVEILISNDPNVTVVYRQSVKDIQIATFRAAISPLKEVSRVVLVCLESEDAHRNLLLAIRQEKMDTEEYVYILLERRRSGFGPKPGSMIWQKNGSAPDNSDADALRAARRFIIMDGNIRNRSVTFTDLLLKKFEQPPLNCRNCTDLDVLCSSAYPLADGMLLFGYIMNKTLEKGLIPNGANLAANAEATRVTLNKNGTKNPVFAFWVLDKNDEQQIIFTIREVVNSSFPNTESQMHLFKPETEIFATRNGTPLNTPKCGYLGELCPLPFWEKYFGIFLGTVATFFLLTFVILAGSIYLKKLRQMERDRSDLLWQVPSASLHNFSKSDRTSSCVSLRSGATGGTKTTISSRKETKSYYFRSFFGNSVAVRKHTAADFTLKEEHRQMMRDMRNVDHDNICKFIGVSMDSSQILSVWKYCARGSIKDVISKGSLHMDPFFKHSLIKDIAEGIYFLHHSQFGAHGCITSKTCVINERWQVKTTFFGLDAIKMREQRKVEDSLWSAPEHIREPNSVPTKAGDIYAFAIVSSEIITNKSAWDLENKDYDLEELIFKIKRGGDRTLIRPSLDSDDEHNASMALLVRECWSEEPGRRPNCDQITTLIQSLNHNRSSNLMDHIFNILEQHASNLEDEVQIRMKELNEEKRKSDCLLYRMLPKQVADRLKTGQSVEPETFDCVTLFLSNVVSFTTIASRCTPLQVETIGDGYLCVSGLPHRNGNKHAKEIAEMSKLLIRAIKTIRIAHLPQERINIRVGLHTGSVITGVVGLTMPRYCLFGDSVNTASRMESNGKPGRIHISTETMKFLTETIDGYQTGPRGEVIVKGKGAVQTHWLLTDDDQGGKAFI